MNEQTATPAAEEKAPKAPKIEQNGVTRPGAGTTTEKVWVIADQLSATAGAPASRGEVLKACEAEGINITTAATQYGKWTKFHGVKAAPKPKAVKEEAKPKKEKKAKVAAPAEQVAAPAEQVPA